MSWISAIAALGAGLEAIGRFGAKVMEHRRRERAADLKRSQEQANRVYELRWRTGQLPTLKAQLQAAKERLASGQFKGDERYQTELEVRHLAEKCDRVAEEIIRLKGGSS